MLNLSQVWNCTTFRAYDVGSAGVLPLLDFLKKHRSYPFFLILFVDHYILSCLPAKSSYCCLLKRPSIGWIPHAGDDILTWLAG